MALPGLPDGRCSVPGFRFLESFGPCRPCCPCMPPGRVVHVGRERRELEERSRPFLLFPRGTQRLQGIVSWRRQRCSGLLPPVVGGGCAGGQGVSASLSGATCCTHWAVLGLAGDGPCEEAVAVLERVHGGEPQLGGRGPEDAVFSGGLLNHSRKSACGPCT